MIPISILDKMRLGAGAAGLVCALGYSGHALAEEPESKKAKPGGPPATEKETPKLSEDQLKTLRGSILNLGDEKVETRDAAYKTILALGKGAIEPLREALKTATDEETKNSLTRLLVDLNPKPAVPDIECKKCSRG